ncbi:MAG: nucleotidyl transferase AbiEii/AbiGii toxin family protein, partial [Schwartzia sp.]|nr:nucleotidyl transferase AbiEii/AbiGii toxin family protein [Schwartzia sp. (in: firmicutes)]
TLHEFVEDFCKERGYAFRIAKDTQTVNRFMIAYDQENNKPLKVEISYRNKNISPDLYQEVDGIQVYTIDRLAQLKAGAYQGREKIRDLYDICFICNKHYYELGEATINQIKDAVLYKGFDYFDYIVETQPDPLINKDKLADSYLRMFDKLDLLYTHEEKSELLANRRKPLARSKCDWRK